MSVDLDNNEMISFYINFSEIKGEKDAHQYKYRFLMASGTVYISSGDIRSSSSARPMCGDKGARLSLYG